MSAVRKAKGVHVVDSSGWLEYLADAPNADFFAAVVEDSEHLIVPTISILEVYRWILRERGEHEALQAAALMMQGRVVDLDPSTAMSAAALGVRLKLPMADSIMLATARANDATLWTQDADFDGIPGVRYRPKPRK